MTRRTALFGMLGLAVALGCRRPSGPVRFPGIAFAGDESLARVTSLTAATPLTLQKVYRVKLDRRLAGAFAEMHQLASGRPADTVRATRSAAGWTLRYLGDSIAALPELPGFRDAERALSAWGARLVKRYPLRRSAVAPADTAAIAASFRRLAMPDVAQGLRSVDRGWATERRAPLLALAGRGLTLLVLQLPRQTEVADPLAARALAAVALAAAAGEDVTRERALLAHRLGYTADASQLASALKADDPVRLFAVGDTGALRQAAERPDVEALVRYLYVVKLAETGEPAVWRRWQRRQPVAPAVHSGVLGAALDFADFDVDADLAPLVPWQLAAEARRLTGDTAAADTSVAARGNFAAAPKTPDWVGLLDPEAADRTAMLAGFEADVGRLGAGFSGPFLDGQALALYFRAQLHAALERTCIHAVDGLAESDAALSLADALAGAPAGLWAGTVDWCRHRGRALAGADSVEALAGDLGAPGALSDAALAGTLKDLVSILRYSDRGDIVAARRYMARLDSRPSHLARAGAIAADLLRDAVLRQHYYGRVLELAPADHPALRVWWASYQEDTAALVALARDPSLDLVSRSDAIWALPRGGGTDAAAVRAFQRLVAEDPDDWAIRSSFVQWLERRGRYREAAGVAAQWLFAHPDTASAAEPEQPPERIRDATDALRYWLAALPSTGAFDRINATSTLAWQYRRLGQTRQAWTVIMPMIGSWQNRTLQRAALIALDLGAAPDAESLAVAAVRRYPFSASARATLARVLWSQRRFADVPAVVNDGEHPLNPDDWRSQVGPAFVESFGYGAAAQEPFEALVASRVPPALLSALADAAHDSGRYELAVALREQLQPDPDERTDAWLATYGDLTRLKGEGAAVEWLRGRWPGGAHYSSALYFYRAERFALMWTMISTADQGGEGSYLWILRALGARQAPLQPEQQRELMEHFRAPSGRFYDIAGRYVLGLEPEGALLKWATDPHRSCEVGYYAGIRAFAEGRYADASNWFRASVETGPSDDWEWLWSKDMLTRLAGVERALPIAARLLAEQQR